MYIILKRILESSNAAKSFSGNESRKRIFPDKAGFSFSIFDLLVFPREAKAISAPEIIDAINKNRIAAVVSAAIPGKYDCV
jgi:hypothetical protein